MRALLCAAAPDALEKINYGIPTLDLKGNLVHFAAAQKHIGFYPGPSGIESFPEECAKYLGGKGTLRFSLTEELPKSLIEKIVRLRVEQNLNKVTKQKKQTK